MRQCNIERPFHGTCLNLTLGMGCSQLPSSFCLKYVEKNPEFQSNESKRKIKLAKKLGLYDGTCGSVGFDVVCEICELELVDASDTKKINGKYVCSECR